MTNSMTLEKNRLSFKAQTIATIIAIIGAVVVPQIFHVSRTSPQQKITCYL